MTGSCKFCQAKAAHSVIWADGRAKILACRNHLQKAKDSVAAQNDKVVSVRSASVDDAISKIQEEYGRKIEMLGVELGKNMQMKDPAIYVMVSPDDVSKARDILPMDMDGYPVRVKEAPQDATITRQTHHPSATETALRNGAARVIIYKGAKYVSLKEMQSVLKKELDAILQEAGISARKMKHQSITIGHSSVLFEGEGVYIRVMYRPYPHLSYEVGFPGGMGETWSRTRTEAIKSLRDFFGPEDFASSEEPDA